MCINVAFSLWAAVGSALPSYMTADMATQLETLTHEASHHEILGKDLGPRNCSEMTRLHVG